MIRAFQSFVYHISKMTSSLTVAFSGKSSSVLQADFFPEIILDEQNEYSCALLDLFIKNNSKNDSTKINISDEMHIDCDIISGSYINGVRKHTIHQFIASTSLVKGRTFVETPKHLIYFPLKTKHLRSIQISIVDRNGKLIVFKECDIVCRINIKKDCEKST